MAQERDRKWSDQQSDADPEHRQGTDNGKGHLHLVPNPSERAESLHRRLQMTLAELQLTAVVGDGWAKATEAGIEFGTINLKQADALVRRLEDLVSPAPTATGPGLDATNYEQLTLF
jgi:hypothetical protein